MKHQFHIEYQQQSIKCVIIHYYDLSKQFCARDLKLVAYSHHIHTTYIIMIANRKGFEMR